MAKRKSTNVETTIYKTCRSCSTSCTSCPNLVTNPVTSHEWGKGRKVYATSGVHPWSFWQR